MVSIDSKDMVLILYLNKAEALTTMMFLEGRLWLSLFSSLIDFSLLKDLDSLCLWTLWLPLNVFNSSTYIVVASISLFDCWRMKQRESFLRRWQTIFFVRC